MKKFILDKIKEKGRKSFMIGIRNSKELQEKIILLTPHLKNGETFSDRCYHIANDLTSHKICTICNSGRLKFNHNKWDYNKACSTKCGANHPDRFEKTKKTNIEKYGVENVYQNEDIKKKIRETNLKNTGFEYNTQTQEFKDYCKKLNQERYGVDNYSQTEEFKEKVKETCMEKYGSSHFLSSDEYKKWMLEKWGVEYPFHGKHLDYELPSGKIVKIQGYEKYALDLLLEKYKEDELLISDREIRKRLGKIEYFDPYKNKTRQYLLDIYIIPENKVIEVKSDFTMLRTLDLNLIKRDSCLERGMNYEFWIFNPKKELVIL